MNERPEGIEYPEGVEGPDQRNRGEKTDRIPAQDPLPIQSPESESELLDRVASTKAVLPVGQQTKTALVYTDATPISTQRMRGIIEYEPSEFTFTAWAGTPLTEIQAVLQRHRQYLPFDPPLVDAGATLGGSIAAGLSGPGRYRYGGIRDFILGVRFLTGDLQWVNAGGKVVKNAAGFDFPKFLVGSLGRFGIMTQLTFKVFPKPDSMTTLSVPCRDHHEAIERIATAARSRWELDAIEYRIASRQLLLRLAGPENACRDLASDIQSKWHSEVMDDLDADKLWKELQNLRFPPDSRTDPNTDTPDGTHGGSMGSAESPSGTLERGYVARIPVTPPQLMALCDSLDHHCHGPVVKHASVAANVLWIRWQDSADHKRIDDVLRQAGAPGLVVMGTEVGPRIGPWPASQIMTDVRQSLDPNSKFPTF